LETIVLTDGLANGEGEFVAGGFGLSTAQGGGRSAPLWREGLVALQTLAIPLRTVAATSIAKH